MLGAPESRGGPPWWQLARACKSAVSEYYPKMIEAANFCYSDTSPIQQKFCQCSSTSSNSSNSSSSEHLWGCGAAPTAAAAAAAAGAAGGSNGAAGFSAEDLQRARASFRILLETACCLFPAAETASCGGAAAPQEPATAAAAAGAAAGGLQTSVLLLLTRLCEEGWAPELLAEMVLAAETHRNHFIRMATGGQESHP
ncbi:hypothetical protein Efla_000412 [Eimeria flavescens]